MILAGCSGGQEQPSGPAARGKELAAAKGCINCHSQDGSSSVGPTWKGLAGSRVRLSDGTVVTATDAYLKESMQQPSAKTVDGFQHGLMETVIKPNTITDAQAAALIAYIKTLK